MFFSHLRLNAASGAQVERPGTLYGGRLVSGAKGGGLESAMELMMRENSVRLLSRLLQENTSRLPG